MRLTSSLAVTLAALTATPAFAQTTPGGREALDILKEAIASA